MLSLAKYSIGVGDRFAHQARAQLRACMLAAEQGAEVIPVWNKSHREHTTVGSEPGSVRAAADAAVRALGWKKPYHVDADHIRLQTVDGFLASSDFYTIDVADSIGQPAAPDAVQSFVERHGDLVGRLQIPGIDEPFTTTRGDIERIAGKYLRGPGSRAHLSPHRRGQGRRPVHHRGVDGRDRQPADAARAAGDTGRRRRRGDPGADDRAEIHWAFQQGRRLRRQPGAV